MIFDQGIGFQQQAGVPVNVQPQPQAQPQNVVVQQPMQQAPQPQMQPVVQQPNVIQQPVQQPMQQPVQQFPQQVPQQQQPGIPGYQFEVYGDNVQQQQQVQQPGVIQQPGVQQQVPQQQVQPGDDINAFIDQMFSGSGEQTPQQPVTQQPFNSQPIINPIAPQAPIVNPVVGQQGEATMNDIVNAMVAQSPGSTRDNIIARLEQTLGKKINLSQPLAQQNPNAGDPRYAAVQAEIARTQQLFSQYIQQQQAEQTRIQENANTNHLKAAMKGLGDKYELSRRDVLMLPQVFTEYLRATQGQVPANITSINFENIFQQLYPQARLRNAAQVQPGQQPYYTQQFTQQQGQQVQQPFPQQQQQGMNVVPQPMAQNAYQGYTEEQLMQMAIQTELGLM